MDGDKCKRCDKFSQSVCASVRRYGVSIYVHTESYLEILTENE